MSKITDFWRNLPLATKLAAFASLLVVVVVGVLTYRTIQREEAAFEADIQDQAALVLETSSRSVEDNLYRRDVDELDEFANIIKEYHQITLVKIFDADGFLLADSALPSPILASKPDPLGQAILESSPNQIYLRHQSSQVIAGKPVILGRKPIGAVAVGISTAALDAKIANVRNESLITGLLMIVVATLASILITRYVTHSLSALTGAAAQLSKSNTVIHVPERGEDEVAQLSRTFNRMAAAVQARERDLKTLAGSLEDQVKTRTAELQTRNQDLTKANEELVVARAQAEEATRLKSQFLATISHELRTPLNAIMGYTQLMQLGVTGEMSQIQRENTDRIYANSNTLLQLINNLLDIAKIEAGRLQLVRKPFNLREWVSAVTRETEGLAQEKSLTFETRIADDLPAEITGDPDRLKQILLNLISNAVKFTEKGNIQLRLSHVDRSKLIIEVTDTGIGIPPHMMETIFDEFRQVDQTTQRKFGGTGLGLSIVRNLALMMNGTVRVESKLGQGSTFTVQVPLLTDLAFAMPQVDGEKIE